MHAHVTSCKECTAAAGQISGGAVKFILFYPTYFAAWSGKYVSPIMLAMPSMLSTIFSGSRRRFRLPCRSACTMQRELL